MILKLYIDLVDVGEKDTFLSIFIFVKRILPVFSLH